LKYLLDTNVISELISKNPNEKVLKFVNSLDTSDVFLSAITIGEIKSGIENIQSDAKKELLSRWLHNDLLNKFENHIIPVDIEIMLTWGSINHELKKQGRPLPIMDSIIGATCLSKKLTLITRNEKDFQNLAIKIINPF
jgi:toxin FitB